MDSLFASMTGANRPGCAAGALQNGKWLHARGYGMANLEHDVAISTGTVFNSGSLSKQFTALSIAILARDGRLSFDDPASKYLPELPKVASTITVRQLLHHTSGLREKWDLLELRGARDGDLVTQSDVLALVSAQRALSFQPGSDHVYNNTGYDLLATIVERVAGEPIRTFAQSHIFAPLGMTRTSYVSDPDSIIPERASGYWWAGAVHRTYMPRSETAGSGGVHTTLEDLGKYADALLSGKLDGKLVATMTATGWLSDGTRLDYALGITVDTWRGLPRRHHGGAIAGFKAELMQFPEQQFTAIVLCNFAQASPQLLAEQISGIFLRDGLSPAARKPSVTPAPFGDPTLASRVVGTYRQTSGGFLLRLERQGDSLYYAVGSLRIPLTANGTTKATAQGYTGVELLIEGVDRSRTPGFRVLWPGFLPSRYVRMEDAVPARETAGLGGRYFSPELQVTWSAAVRGDTVTLESPTGRRVPLRVAFRNGFSTTDGSWVVTVERNPKGAVDALLVTMGRSRNIRFERR